ncbi:methyltransferase domain-containing protein [Thiomonas bhubaneswarensis]|uniref:Methyltransferase domain/Glycosyl transferases group 1 n=1 Tax=Thiomonas bhubaneswarensis TaxID=339866 RepID=A0A0K6HPP4_9BURK|nr:methyltransferase domain-containing protein [Thiomonas bhubaneswarensis]CUA92849.1 Methyltransferase domain/Glycosyl transferases group 1 [Thiomonas bhubaneswarensis]
MKAENNINSGIYWNHRFEENWEAFQGPAQSRFFARLAIENLPQWLTDQLQRQSLTLCDWGCAQGDGTDVWASYIGSERLAGVDFSSIAIEQAAQRYPAIQFLCEDWLTDREEKQSVFDVVFSSNTLEHFYRPYAVLKEICNRATKALILAIPYRELDRHHEHFYTFLPGNIPSKIGDGFRLVWSRVIDCRNIKNTAWSGEQIILVFAKEDWVDSFGLTLENLAIEQTDYTSEIGSLQQTITERDGQIASLNHAVAERDGQIASLNHAVAERDGQIASLNHAVAERDGQIASLNHAVAERDGQIASLNHAVAERDGQISILNHEVMKIRQSTSWRITAPVRQVRRLILASTREDARYALLKSIYWGLPERLRILLNKPRHNFVARRLCAFGENCVASDQTRSVDAAYMMPWVARALAENKIAVIPCGFEFDELVNQRPINAAKHYSAKGFLVLYVAWQWTPEESLSKGVGEVFSNVIQVPLYEFLKGYRYIPLENKVGHYIITMPARQFTNTVDAWRSNGGIVIYDIMDEWEEFNRAGQAPWYDKSLELELVLKADFVSAVSPKLQQKFQHIRTDIAVIGNGYTPSTLGVSNKGIAGKRHDDCIVIGYFGHLTEAWFDWDLLFSVARQSADYYFEIIGYGEPEWVQRKIAQFDNISLVGKVFPANLHAYVSRWNVAIIPFVQSDLSDAVDPIKIYEYLYFGLPVVVTGIDHLRYYPKTYFATSSTIREVIAQALADTTTADVLEAFLSKTTWEARFDSLMTLVSAKKGLFVLYEY